MSEAVADAAAASVKRYVYLGGCPRDYSAACPLGWSAGSVRVVCCALVLGCLSRVLTSVSVAQGDACEPPASYSGACGATAFKSLGRGQLEDVVLKCRFCLAVAC